MKGNQLRSYIIINQVVKLTSVMRQHQTIMTNIFFETRKRNRDLENYLYLKTIPANYAHFRNKLFFFLEISKLKLNQVPLFSYHLLDSISIHSLKSAT